MENDETPAVPMNRQQICAALSVSEATIRRLEQAGLPYIPVGARSHRYDLAECKAWLRNHFGSPALAQPISTVNEKWKGDKEFVASCERAQRRLRVYPSK